MQPLTISKKARLDIVFFLIILSNIINMIYPKGSGFENQEGIEYQISKYTYGLAILMMLPSLIYRKKYYFMYMKYMAIYIFMHFIIATLFSYDFDLGSYLKTFMICLSFIFFEDVFRGCKINKYLLYGFVFSIFIKIAYLTFIQNRIEIAIENEGKIAGGQGITVSIIYLLPLIFYLFKGKMSSILFLIGLIFVVISLRRTAMLAYLVCLPFVYKRLSATISIKAFLGAIIILAIIVIYVITNYWYIIELRFNDAFEASNAGYYGSGRTGWWTILLSNFLNSPLFWIQGFGLGQVVKHMTEAGFPHASAHCEYIEIGYSFGLIGLFFWYGTVYKIYKLTKFVNIKDYKSIIYMGVFSYLISGLFSGAAHEPNFVSLAVFAALLLKEKGVKELQAIHCKKHSKLNMK